MNLAIIHVLLKEFCAPSLAELEAYFPTPEEKLGAVRNSAADAGNDEIVQICDWIEEQQLTRTYFPEVS